LKTPLIEKMAKYASAEENKDMSRRTGKPSQLLI